MQVEIIRLDGAVIEQDLRAAREEGAPGALDLEVALAHVGQRLEVLLLRLAVDDDAHVDEARDDAVAQPPPAAKHELIADEAAAHAQAVDRVDQRHRRRAVRLQHRCEI